MKLKLTHILSALGALLGTTWQAQAQWTLIDNFDSYDNSVNTNIGTHANSITTVWAGMWNGTNNAQILDDIVATDNSLAAFGAGGGWRGAETDLATSFGSDFSLPDGGNATYFFQVWNEGNANVDCMIGLTESTATVDETNSWADFAIMPFVAGNASTADLNVHGDNGTGGTVISGIADQTWYNVWLVVDNSAKTFDIYTSTGTSAGALGLSGVEFGRITDPVNLSAFAISNAQDSDVRIDNLYVASGVDTTYPVPPPSDSDGDTLPDSWEQLIIDDNPGDAIVDVLDVNPGDDYDGDGSSNLQEFTAGSDPTDPNSTHTDTDGDGLADAWEQSSFGDLSQDGTGDPDHDFATNAEEEAVGTLGNDATDWPDEENGGLGDGMGDAWEALNGLNTTIDDSGLDPDLDDSDNLAEHDAGSDPQDTNWTPTNALLMHRWSFTNSLTDSAGSSDATIVDVGPNDATLNATSVTLTGGAKGDSDYVRLGTNLIGGITSPVTIELWATPHSVQNWSRIFDFGTDIGTSGAANNYLFMGWSVGTNQNNDRVAWDSPTGGEDGVAGSNAPYLLDVPYHIIMTIEPAYNTGDVGGSTVTWYSSPANSSQANGHPLFDLKGSFFTNLHLVDLVDAVNMLGRSAWPDNTAHSTYDEVRIWSGALTETERELFHLLGPDNIDRTNGDGDIFPDAWETTRFGNTTTAMVGADSDSDGDNDDDELLEESDPDNIFSTQSDADADGLDDFNFELYYFSNLLQDGTDDPDNDLIDNETEEAGGTDPTDPLDSPDGDDDNLPDGWELVNFGDLDEVDTGDPDGDGDDNATELFNNTDPDDRFSSQDSDGDNLPDGWETFYFADLDETDLTDPDGDCSINANEFAALTNPDDINDYPDTNGDGLADGHILIAGDGLGTSSFDSGLNWDDGVAPMAGCNYLVAIDKIRTPDIADTSIAFAGDNLVLASGGVLTLKGARSTFSANYRFDGGLVQNGTSGNEPVTLAGTITVTKPSPVNADNDTIILSATISGSQDLTLGGANGVVITGANSFTGDYIVNGSMTLSSSGVARFEPGAPGVTNAITGTGPAALNGTFNIDLGGASSTPGDSWTLVSTTGAVTYGAGFTVQGFTPDAGSPGDRIWTSGSYQYDELTDVLSVVVSNDGDGDGMDDTWEFTNFGDYDQDETSDFDGDGTLDLTEFRLGLDPTKGTSRFELTTIDNDLSDGFTISWSSKEGTSFTVWRSNDGVNWTDIATGVPAAADPAASTSYTDPSPPALPTLYYTELE